MAEEDVQLVRNAFEAEGLAGLAEVAEAYWDPDIEYVEDPRWPGAARYKGREEVLRIFRSYIEALGPGERGSAVVEQIRDAGGRQVAFVRFEGRSASGVPHDHLWGYVVEVKNRHIVYFRAYYEPEEALEAAGLGR